MQRYAPPPSASAKLQSLDVGVGPNDPSVAATLTNLATLKAEIGEYAEAESLYQ